MGDHSPIDAFLKKFTHGGLHHICIEVGESQNVLLFINQCGWKIT